MTSVYVGFVHGASHTAVVLSSREASVAFPVLSAEAALTAKLTILVTGECSLAPPSCFMLHDRITCRTCMCLAM